MFSHTPLPNFPFLQSPDLWIRPLQRAFLRRRFTVIHFTMSQARPLRQCWLPPSGSLTLSEWTSTLDIGVRDATAQLWSSFPLQTTLTQNVFQLCSLFIFAPASGCLCSSCLSTAPIFVLCSVQSPVPCRCPSLAMIISHKQVIKLGPLLDLF